MKKILLSITTLVILGLPNASAQIINAGFEKWTQDPLAPVGVKDPNGGNATTGWWDFNFTNSSLAYFNSSPVTVFQDSLNPRAKSGKYYATIVSKKMSATAFATLQPYGFWYPQTNGIILTAYVSIVGFNITFKPGEPWHGGRSPSFSFWYRYIPAGGAGSDSCNCVVGMYHWNTSGPRDSLQLIGGGYWASSAVQSTWKEVTVPILYDSANSIPDTIVVQFSASNLNAADHPMAGDTMDIDSSTIVLGVGSIPDHLDNINLYPNPANTAINLAISGFFPGANVEVYDITGKAMGTYAVHNNFLTINTQSYTNGIYLYKLLNSSGDQLNVGKFSVFK